MRRLLLCCEALLTLAAPPVFAASGLNFTWSPNSQCQSPAIVNQDFACNSNDQAFTMVGSFRPGIALTQFYGLEAIIDGVSEGSDPPAWWQSLDAGSCRENSAVPNARLMIMAGPCSKLWTATPAGASARGRRRSSRRRCPSTSPR